MPDWAKIFRKASHTFTQEEIDAAQWTNLSPLEQYCPKFWVTYEPLAKRQNQKMEKIFQLDCSWTEAVQSQNFKEAKRLFRLLKKVKV